MSMCKLRGILGSLFIVKGTLTKTKAQKKKKKKVMEATLCVCVVEFCLTVVYGLKTYKTNRSLSFVAEQEFYILIAKLKPEGFWVY